MEPVWNKILLYKKDGKAENRIRIGEQYQAECPRRQPATLWIQEPAENVWTPVPQADKFMFDMYMAEAKIVHKYNEEQALAMLVWHEYNYESARLDLSNFAPIPRMTNIQIRF